MAKPCAEESVMMQHSKRLFPAEVPRHGLQLINLTYRSRLVKSDPKGRCWVQVQ